MQTTKSNNIMKNIILLTPSKPGVLLRKTFFYTSHEASSVGLAKACILQKIYSVIEKLDSRSTFLLITGNHFRVCHTQVKIKFHDFKFFPRFLNMHKCLFLSQYIPFTTHSTPFEKSPYDTLFFDLASTW